MILIIKNMHSTFDLSPLHLWSVSDASYGYAYAYGYTCMIHKINLYLIKHFVGKKATLFKSK